MQKTSPQEVQLHPYLCYKYPIQGLQRKYFQIEVDFIVNGEVAESYTIVIFGDVTGDGVIDALDCMISELAKNGNTELTGLFYIAGNLATDTGITGNDVGAIVNKAIPDKIA